MNKKKKIISLSLPNWVNYEDEVGGSLLRKSIVEKWCQGLISNFEYLMHLNTMVEFLFFFSFFFFFWNNK